ncbi:MAG TPA: allantoicase, partial [Candidatus Dormibacteraeota bacterium]|nr:allantoicase [Candidatus Dormibacteraeota bacterium]
QPDTYHVFPLGDNVTVGSIRLDAFPDGGISRVRAIGTIEPGARRRAGYSWFNSLPSDQAVACLLAAGLPRDSAAELVGLRPVSQTPSDLRQLAPLLEGPGGR